jgi:site-specific DNA-methyltransferase (adenine-specific)
MAMKSIIGKIVCRDSLDLMKLMPNNFVDLTVTSPPYDNLRKYHGFSFRFEEMAKELYRVTKQGGVLVWVVGDATVNGNESGTSFKQALYFKEVGFNLGDTMIWQKQNPFNFGSNYFYPQSFEYMFVLTKGKIKTSHLIKDRIVKTSGKTFKQTRRSKNDFMEYDKRIITTKNVGKRYNIWTFSVKSHKGHPATFPEQIANDHILSWSNKGNIVFDPFSGSGTTALAAEQLGRRWIACDISKEYCDIANKRINIYRKMHKIKK